MALRLLVLALGSRLFGQTAGGDVPSVEEILRTQITSVGRKAQQVAKAPAAVFVLTQEDIRRSGATNLPDLLRIVPGMVVARINGADWAISARGDARQFSNKMLIMIDGRSVYGRLFSGVFWNAQDVFLEDVERIEVIRGPGAVMWGSNAVNGVINIISRKSSATQGGLVTLGTGTDDRGLVAMRYGGRWGDRLSYRVWGKFNEREYRSAGDLMFRPDPEYGPTARPLIGERGQRADTGRQIRAGFRMDWEKSAQDNVTVMGEMYGLEYRQDSWLIGSGGRVDRQYSRDEPWGGNALARWTRTSSADRETTVQLWGDHAVQRGTLYTIGVTTLDAEVQHRRKFGENNELHLGGGYRMTSDSIDSVPFQFRPAQRRDGLWNGVIRDEYQLVPGKLTLSAGLRGEHNAYTGFEFQPSVRLLYAPVKQQAWWVAWSRAVRTPSRTENDTERMALGVTFFDQLPIPLQLRGDTGFLSERLHAFEAGYRFERKQRWSMDLAWFENRYSRLSSAEPGRLLMQLLPTGLDLRQEIVFRNGQQGVSRGAELALAGTLRPWWRMHGSYSYLRTMRDRSPGFSGIEGRIVGSDPSHQVKLRSMWNLGKRWQADVSVYGVGRVPWRNVPGYVRADTRLSWRPSRTQEWSLVGQDLFSHGRLEWQPELYIFAIPTRRALILRWTVHF